MKVAILGAGNVGLGFLGLEMYLRDYQITFIDANERVATELNKQKRYLVNFFDGHSSQTVRFNEALHISQEESVNEVLRNADLLLTAVGTENLPYLGLTIAQGIGTNKPQLVIACENAPDNTGLLKSYVSKFISDPISNTEFANCVIDRICLRDENGPLVEPTFEWIVETSSDLLLDVQKANTLEPYFTRKLFLVNCAHALIGYMGVQKGHNYVADAFRDESLLTILRRALEESCFGLSHEYGFDNLEEYTQNLERRLSNPIIKDDVTRLVRNPARKLQQKERLIGPALLAYKHGVLPQNLCKGIAYLLIYCSTHKDSLENSLREEGVRNTLSKYTQLEPHHDLLYRIELEYDHLLESL